MEIFFTSELPAFLQWELVSRGTQAFLSVSLYTGWISSRPDFSLFGEDYRLPGQRWRTVPEGYRFVAEEIVATLDHRGIFMLVRIL